MPEIRPQGRSLLKLGSKADLSDVFLYLPGKKTKTKKERRLELPDVLREWFLHADVVAAFGPINRRLGGEPLFINPDATQIPAKRWGAVSERNTIRRACDKVGVPRIAPNQLGRHFFGTSNGDEDCNIYALKNFLGHSDIKTTERYIRLRPQSIGKLSSIKGGPQLDHTT